MDILFRGIYILQSLLWLGGIFRMEITESMGRRASAVILLIIFGFWDMMFGLGVNASIIWMGVECVAFSLFFSVKVGETSLKFLFSLFYSGMIDEPFYAISDILWKNGFLWLNRTAEEFFLDILLTIILIGISCGLNNNIHWKNWVRNFPLHYVGIGVLIGFCASGTGSLAVDLMMEIPAEAFVFFRLLAMITEETVYLFGFALASLADLNKRYERELKRREEVLKQEERHFFDLKEQIDKTNKIRHDMNAHLCIIRAQLDNKNYCAASDYLDELIGNSKIKESQRIDVGNEIVNAVIAVEIARFPKDIKFTYNGVIRGDLNIRGTDLCTIFANLFSNAREACEKIKTQNKVVTLQLGQYKSYQTIRMENSIDYLVDTKRMGTFTSKQDKSIHGWGMLNVMEVVERYDGEIRFESEEGYFQVFICLKCVHSSQKHYQ